MTFKHIIGKSTFKYGFTIPKRMYKYLLLPDKGEKRKVRLLFDKNQESEVWLYRVKNSIGHLQIRYDGKYGDIFRNWLIKRFSNSWENTKINCSEYFEVTILNDCLFEIKEFPLIPANKLFIEEIITHKIKANTLFINEHYIEIVEAIRNINFKQSERQIYYNSQINLELSRRGWLNEQKVVNDKKVRLKCDFRKGDFQLEVEFGNARTYYQDIIKFIMSYNVGVIKIGGLIVPSSNFAKHLCHLGHLNAIKRSDGKKSKYSGMMSYKKAITEFQYVKDIFNIPFFILAVGFK